ncbi:hypothetical protein AVEN_169896-1 [Araneus ventricosus]|uniref:Uncharacterized protein n=1 Tax=Araneus ventricosus TaxID=182803 RepID=A0A4Y2P067_ARAVE|nr:hypothetical protein AVEN_169896-1 [Araneus ventricosus]
MKFKKRLCRCWDFDMKSQLKNWIIYMEYFIPRNKVRITKRTKSWPSASISQKMRCTIWTLIPVEAPALNPDIKCENVAKVTSDTASRKAVFTERLIYGHSVVVL